MWLQVFKKEDYVKEIEYYSEKPKDTHKLKNKPQKSKKEHSKKQEAQTSLDSVKNTIVEKRVKSTALLKKKEKQLQKTCL